MLPLSGYKPASETMPHRAKRSAMGSPVWHTGPRSSLSGLPCLLPLLGSRRAGRRPATVVAAGDAEQQELQRLRFRGVSLLFGAPALHRLKRAHAAVLGIGGVGSWVVESLARSGIGGLTLVDLDEICISNTNRQLHTLANTVGRPKVDVMAERVRLINPECEVQTVQDFFVEETEGDILDSRPFDVVVDAIDGVANKCRLIYACRERQIPIVMSGGLGGKADPSMFREDDITRVHGDGLTRRVRSTLRSKYGFPSGESSKKRWGIPVVYSPETPKFVTDKPLDEGDSPRKSCDSYGTFCPAAGVQGFTLAACAAKIVMTGAEEESA